MYRRQGYYLALDVAAYIATPATDEPNTTSQERKVSRGIRARIIGSRDILYDTLYSIR